MLLEATRLLTVLAAMKSLQCKESFRSFFEKKVSMRESGGEEDTFANLLPNKFCDDLI